MIEMFIFLIFFRTLTYWSKLSNLEQFFAHSTDIDASLSSLKRMLLNMRVKTSNIAWLLAYESNSRIASLLSSLFKNESSMLIGPSFGLTENKYPLGFQSWVAV